MLRVLTLASVAAFLAAAQAAPQTVLTRDGRKLVGDVTREENATVVRGTDGAVRVPPDQVVIVFTEPREATKRAGDRLDQAMKLYEEARALPDRDPVRLERLEIALDILAEARDVYDAVSRHYTTGEFRNVSDATVRVLQLMRLCRDARGSKLAAGGMTKPVETPLATGTYRPVAPPPRARPWVDEKELGPGQVALLQGLEVDDAKTRAECVRRLISPPAPHAVPAVVARLERERDPEVMKAIGEFLARHDVVLSPKQLAWARRDSDANRRAFAILLLKRAGDKGACEWLAEWLVEAPPLDNLTRAAMCSAFRRMREHAVVELKSALAKTRDRTAQIEIVKQIGMLRDRRLGSVLLQLMPNYPSHAVIAFLVWGREAVPECTRGMRGASQEVKRWCTFVCRKVTELDNYNPGPFEDWYVKLKKEIADDEAKWWRDQAEKDFPVDPDTFKEFNRKLEDILQ